MRCAVGVQSSQCLCRRRHAPPVAGARRRIPRLVRPERPFGRLGRRASLPDDQTGTRREIERRDGSPAHAASAIETTPGGPGAGPEPVARLLVHPLVAHAAGAGEQRVRRRPRPARPPRSGPGAPGRARGPGGRARPSPGRRASVAVAQHRRATAPTSRPCDRRDEHACPRASQPATSSNDSSSAGIRTPGLARTSWSQQARCSVNSSPASARLDAARTTSVVAQRPTAEQQVGPAVGRTAYGLLVAPCGDRAVVAGEQHRRDVEAAPGGGLGVDRVLEQAVLVGLLGERLGVAHEAGQQPDDGLDDGQRGHLAAVEHVVAERQLPHVEPPRPRRRPPAGRCPRSDRRRRPGARAPASSRATAWVNGAPARRRHDQRRRRPGPASSESSASPHGSGFITMPAPPPYGVSSTVRCRSWVQSRRSWTAISSSPAVAGLAGQREVERVEVRREDRDDVDPHAVSLVARPRERRDQARAGRRPRRGRRRRRPRGPAPPRTAPASSRPSGAADLEEVLGAVHDAGHLAERARRRGPPRAVRPAGGRRTPRGPPGVSSAGDLRRAAACRGPPRPRCGRRARRSAPAASTGASGWRRPSSAVSALAEPPRALGRAASYPAANRRSGSSVRTSTVTSPRRPCGLPIRPTTTSMRLLLSTRSA